MALQIFAFLLVVLCLAAQAWSAPLGCFLDGNLLQKSHNLLRDMGGNFPQKCIEEAVITIPSPAYATNGTTEEKGVKVAISETLNNINVLFEDSHMPAEWDENMLDYFQNIVFRQADDFNKCAMSLINENVKVDIDARTAILRTYFEKMKNVLQEKNFTFCAWEIVREELTRTLHFILEHNVDSLRWPRRI